MSASTDIATIATTIRAKMEPHLAAMSQLYKQQIKDWREIDSDREAVILRLQQMIADLQNNMVTSMEMFVAIRDGVDDMVELVTTLDTKVNSYETEIARIEHRLDLLERD